MRRNIRTACLPLLALVGAAVLLTAPPAEAQSGEQLQQFVARTAEILDLAADLVAETDSQPARRVLDGARRLHEQSRDHAQNGRQRMALTMSKRARTAAQHALRLAREARVDQPRAQQRLERFTDYRDQVLERAREAGDERAMRFVREAEGQALRAREQYQQGNHDVALHLMSSAEEMLSRAARLLFEGGGGGALQREIERAREAIERAGDGSAEELLRSATEALDRAEEFARNGQPARALQSVRLARRLTAEAASAASNGLDPATVAAQLQRWDSRYEQVSEHVSESSSEAAQATLRRASDHRERAEELLNDDQPGPALRQLKAAFDLLGEADELVR